MNDEPTPAQRLTELYEANKELEPVRLVYEQYMRAIELLREMAAQFWALGETRWSAAIEARASDLELAARRHIQNISQRYRSGPP